MAYGKPKIKLSQVKADVLKAIGDALDRNSDLTGGLAAYGYEAEFSVTIKLASRGESTLTAKDSIHDGEMDAKDVDADGEEDKKPKVEIKTVAVTGRSRRPRANVPAVKS